MSEDPARGRPTESDARSALRASVERAEPGAALRLGDLLRQDGDAQAAEEMYELAIAREEPGAWVHLGDIKRGVDNEAAVHAYREALGRGEMEAAVRLGDVLQVGGRLEEAEQAYRTAFEGGDTEGRNRLGQLLVSLGRLEEAAALYQEGLQRGEFEMAVRSGDVLKLMGHLSRAEEMYRRAVDRGDPEANTRLGDLLKDTGLLGEAVAAFERGALTGDPGAGDRAAEARREMEAGDSTEPPVLEPPWLASWSQGGQDWVHGCAFAGSGALLATAGEEGLRLWDPATGRDVAELPSGRAWACAFSSDGGQLACAGEEGLRLWRVAEGPERAEETILFEDEMWTCAFSHDGRLLACAGASGLWLVKLVRGRDDAGPLDTVLPAEGVGGCAFSPDGRLLASAGDDGVRLWDVASESELRTLAPASDLRGLTPPASARGACAFSPDGRLLASTSEDGLRVWDLSTGRLLTQATVDVGLGGCAFSPAGPWLANGTDEGLRVWEVLEQGDLGRSQLISTHRATGACAFSHDGRLLVSAGQDGVWVGSAASGGGGGGAGRGTSREGPETSPDLAEGAGELRGALPGMAPDVAEGQDLLDIGADVRAIANVVAAKTLTPPLSIGLFGDWGSGKSFFIGQVQACVRELAAQSRRAERSAYCGYVRNITFNAWHYTDANLWASLVTHIFDELGHAEPNSSVTDGATAAAQLARLESRLAENSALKDRLQRARGHRRQVEARRNLLRLTWKLTGTEDELSLGEIEQDVQSIRSALGLLLPNKRARLAFAALALVAAAAGFGLVAIVGGEALFSALAAVAAAVAAPAAALQFLRKRVLGLLKQAGTAARAIDVKETDIDAELELAGAAEQRLQQELSDLSAGRRLARVAVERSGDYREHLGLVSRIHDDFVRMSTLLLGERDAREPAAGGGEEDGEQSDLPSIERIVLYIDDLDRCPPGRVMEVLEAVHLILAVPLFVVVVAVDPRWLLQSLKFHYAETLARGGQESELAQGEADRWGASPIDYLEKIIHVPFTLRPMSRASVASLVNGLMGDREPAAQAGVDSEAPQGALGASRGGAVGEAPPLEEQAAPGAPAGRAEAPADGDEAPAERAEARAEAPTHLDPGAPHAVGARSGKEQRSAPDARESPAAAASANVTPIARTLDLSSRPIVLTDAERDFAAVIATSLRTPRTVKKFTNLYRLLRAGLDERSGGLDRFLAEDDANVAEYQAALILLAAIIAFPQDASGFLVHLIREPNGALPWLEFVRATKVPAIDGDLRAFLEGLATAPGSPSSGTCAPFQRWALEVSRYSFTTGQEVFARTSTLPAAASPP